MFERRVVSNVLYFKSNYALLALVLSVYSVVTRPRILFLTLPLLLLWIYVLAIRRKPIMLRGKTMTTIAKVAALVPFSFIVLALGGCVMQTMKLAALSIGAVLLHAALRPANIKTAFNKLGSYDAKDRVKYGWMADGSAVGGEATEAEATSAAAAVPASPTIAKKTALSGSGKAILNDPEDASGGTFNEAARPAAYAPVDGPKSMWDAPAAPVDATNGGMTTTTRRTSVSRSGNGSIYGDTPATAWHASADLQPVQYGHPPLTPRDSAGSSLPRPSDVKAHVM